MINAAIIGSGIGLKHLEAIDGYKSAKVKMICESNLKKIKKLRKKFPKIEITDKEEDIFKNKEINLVSIASHDQDHFRQIMKCIENKKHMIVEKPFCLTKSEFQMIKKNLENNKNLKFMCNLVLRVNSLFKKIRLLVKYKNVFYIESDYIWGRKYKLFGWRSKTKNYSLTLGAAIHVIDLVMWFVGKKPISVQSFGNNIATKNSKFKKKSFIIYILKFPGNLLVKITANAGGIYNHFHELKVFLKDKTIINAPSAKVIYKMKKNKKISKIIMKNEYPDKSNRKKLIRNLIDQIKLKNIKSFLSRKEQFDLMNVCFAADKSLKTGKQVIIKY